jgi:hypothetical protein
MKSVGGGTDAQHSCLFRDFAFLAGALGGWPVITPTFGLGWIIAEDALDKYLVKPVEDRTGNIWIRLALRSTLNPARSFAKAMRGKLPWHRDTRPGIHAYSPNDMMALVVPSARTAERDIPDAAGPAPFEFSVAFQPERLYGGGQSSLLRWRVGGGISHRAVLATRRDCGWLQNGGTGRKS